MEIPSNVKIIAKSIIKNKNIKDEFILSDLLLKFNNQKTNGLLIGQIQSGKTNQIIKCFKEALNNYDFKIILFFHATTTSLADQQEKRLKDNGFKILNSKDIDIKDDKYYEHIKKSKKVIICCLKEKTHIDKIFNLLQSISGIKNEKILIIDDESDFASVNTSKKNEDPKIINNLINKIYKDILSNNNGGLLKVTATPFANILNKDENIHFIFSMKTNYDYYGIKNFNALQNFYIPVQKLNDSFEDMLYKTLVIYLSQSFLMFLEDNSKKSCCLINISNKLNEHKNYKDYLISVIKNKYKELLDNVFNYIQNLKNNVELTEIENFFDYNILNFKNLSINCSNSTNKDFDEKKLSIIIGGVFLSRGNTFDNLITELLWQDSSSLCIDVLWQKARWLGYRKDKIKYMNLITSNEVIEVFKKSNYLINLFWETNNGAELDVSWIKEQLINSEKTIFKGICYTNNEKRK